MTPLWHELCNCSVGTIKRDRKTPMSRCTQAHMHEHTGFNINKNTFSEHSIKSPGSISIRVQVNLRLLHLFRKISNNSLQCVFFQIFFNGNLTVESPSSQYFSIFPAPLAYQPTLMRTQPPLITGNIPAYTHQLYTHFFARCDFLLVEFLVPTSPVSNSPTSHLLAIT